ncbi:MAG TPA: hypothetical protein VJ891_01915 [Casimicrobiaceae bacterium]|nr:hypothetical protein [Casimicrobiaceae bacterium]
MACRPRARPGPPCRRPCSAKFNEVQKFCSLTTHAWDGFWFIANGRVWKSVPPTFRR